MGASRREPSNRKNYFATLGASAIGSILTSLLGLVSVPIALGYWKTELFGVWTLVISLLVYLGATNFGIPQATGILVAKNIDVGHKMAILRKGALLTGSISLAVAIAFFLLTSRGDKWVLVLGRIPPNLVAETAAACRILGTLYLLGIPISLGSAALTGFQRAYWDNLFNALIPVGYLASLIAVVVTHGSLVDYAVAYGATGITLNTARVVTFLLMRRHGLGSRYPVSGEPGEDAQTRAIVVTGLRVFAAGLASMVTWSADNFLIARFIGVAEVARYSITFKVYTVLFGLTTMVNLAVMPLFAREYGRENWQWLREKYELWGAVASFLGGLSWVGGVVFMQLVVDAWVGNAVYAGLVVTVALGCFSYLHPIGGLNAGVVNSFNYTKRLPLFNWSETAIKIGVSILMLRLIGVGGAAVGGAVAAAAIPYFAFPLLLNRRTGGKLGNVVHENRLHLVGAILPSVALGVATNALAGHLGLRIFLGVTVVGLYILLSYLTASPVLRDFARQALASVGLRLRGLTHQR